MNWYILIPFAILVIVLIAWLVIRNNKDEEKLQDQLNQDFTKKNDVEGDINTEEILK